MSSLYDKCIQIKMCFGCCKKCFWCIICIFLVCGWLLLAILISTGHLHISDNQWEAIQNEKEYFSHQFWYFWHHNYYIQWMVNRFVNKSRRNNPKWLIKDFYVINATSFQFSLTRDLKPGEIIALRPHCQKFSNQISYQAIIAYSLTQTNYYHTRNIHNNSNQHVKYDYNYNYKLIPKNWNHKAFQLNTINWVSNKEPIAMLRQSQLWAYPDNYQVCLLTIKEPANQRIETKYNKEKRSVLVRNMPHLKEQKAITLLRYHIASHAFDSNFILSTSQRQTDNIPWTLNTPSILPNVFGGMYKKLKTLRVHSFGASFKALYIPSNTIVEIFMTHRLNDDHDIYFSNNMHILKRIDHHCYTNVENINQGYQLNDLSMKPLFPKSPKNECHMIQQFQWNSFNNRAEYKNIDIKSLPNVCIHLK